MTIRALRRAAALSLTFAVAAVALTAVSVTDARAATYQVDTTADDASKTTCADDVPGDCSLRGAVARANGDAATDTIVVPAGTYTLSVAAPCFFAAAYGDSENGIPVVAICVNSNVELVGAGADQTIIQSNGSDRIFAVSKLKTVSISNVTLTGGRGGFGYAIGGGGAVNNHGTLTIADSVLTSNQSSSGGAIFNLGTLTVLRSTITGNTASSGGGGINNTCCGGPITVTVIDSTIAGNSAQNGGGINNNGLVTVLGSTISGNTANLGGGITNFGGNVTVRNSTISGNTGGGGGIAIGLSSPDGASVVRLESATITKNAGTPYGGGLYIVGTQPVTVRNTIIADNTTSGGYGPDCGGRIVSEGYNLIQSTANCQIVGDTTGNVTGVPARLGALADNGGLTRTHAPLGASGATPASPAIDAGNPADPASGGTACPAFDQRGVLRPVGARCDIGAFERGASLSVSAVSPSRAGNAAPILARVAGSSFDQGSTVKLVRAGEADVIGSPVRVESAGAALATTFDVAGRAPGAWDVVVTNENGTIATLPGALTLEAPLAPQLWAEIVGRTAVRAGAPVRYAVVYGNRGNADAVGVPVSLTVPKAFVFDLISEFAAPPPSASQAITDFSEVPIVAGVAPDADTLNVPLLLPVVPAGFIGTIDFVLTLPAGIPHGTHFTLSAKINPVPWLLDQTTFDDAVTSLVDGARAYATRVFAITVPESVDGPAADYARMQLSAIAAAGRDALVSGLGQPGPVYSPVQLMIDVAAFMRAQATTASRSPSGWETARECVAALASLASPDSAQAQTVCPPCICGQPIAEGCRCRDCVKPYLPPNKPPKPGLTPAECNETPNHKVSADGSSCIPRDTTTCAILQNVFYTDPNCLRIPILESTDPNDKTPSPGSGPDNAVTGDVPLKYGISFENLATASAPAQVVTITDQLDTTSLDLSTFAFGPIAIADVVTIVPPTSGVSDFTGGADLRPALNVVVRVDAHLDLATGIATWLFTSLDPVTGQLTDDPFAGFLPPNTSPPAGEGHVMYTVSAMPAVASGTVVKNKATIVFDVNAPIDTPQISNVIDRTAPTSQVDSIESAECGATDLTLHWSGTDVGAGIAGYSVFVSVDGGPYAPVVLDTAELSMPFTAEVGKTYRFYSTARDLLGHVEAAPATPDVTRTIGACGTYDLAIAGITRPSKVSLTAKKPSKLAKVAVLVENRGPGPETIPDAAKLAQIVTLDVTSLGAGCTSPVATLHAGKPQKPLPLTVKSKRRFTVLFDVTIGCANDAATGSGHEDYRLSAHVNRAALGDPDVHPADDSCPRSVTPPYVVDPYPDGKIRDKGCGAKKPDKTRGGDVLIDVSVR